MVLKGKHKSRVVKISQWSNDWFTTDTGEPMDRQPFSPTALAFKSKDFKIIREHKNNGMMFAWFEPKVAPAWTGDFIFTFQKRKYGTN